MIIENNDMINSIIIVYDCPEGVRCTKENTELKKAEKIIELQDQLIEQLRKNQIIENSTQKLIP